MSWTDERVETLKTMWAEGKSASQIAKELGGVTRNAVIGKVHRLGLSNRVGGPDRPEDELMPLDPPAIDPHPEAEAEPAAPRPGAPSSAAGLARPFGKEPAPRRAQAGRASRCRRSPRPRRSAPRRWRTSPRSPRRRAGCR